MTRRGLRETPTIRLPDGRRAVVYQGKPPRAESAPAPYKPATRAQLDAWYDELRAANRKAEKASARWDARKSWLRAYCEVNNYDEKAARDKMINDWECVDAHDDWSFWEREVKRLQGMIQMEATMGPLYASR